MASAFVVILVSKTISHMQSHLQFPNTAITAEFEELNHMSNKTSNQLRNKLPNPQSQISFYANL